jgi:hypothetical protein
MPLMPLTLVARIMVLRPALRWLMLAPLAPPSVAGLLAAAAVGWLLLAPASTFLHVTALQLVAAPALDPFVIQRVVPSPFLQVPVHFTIEVRELRGAAEAPVQCVASGVSAVHADPFGETRVRLARPGGEACRLIRGLAYHASATWRFSVLGVEKIAVHRTDVVVVPVVPVAIDPLMPPNL